MGKDQNLQKIDNNIFSKIYKFLKSFFYNKKEIIEDFEPNIKNEKSKDDFIKDIKININKDTVPSLKKKFDNRMIDVKEIPMKDKLKLLEMYKKEILEIKNTSKK